MARKIEVQILGDPKQLEAALGKAQAKTSKFGSAVSAGAKVGAVALGGLAVAAKIGFDELQQGQRVAAQTNAVLKSTGGVANVSAKSIRTYAQAMLQKTGIDDEAIASSENLLLTFRNIRNEAGKGNKIFDRARQVTLNLSVAMHKDLNSSAILVGKALNDPIKGLSSLSRVGVQFSDQQKKLIKHLVDTGHSMKAQKIILGELRAEFGGSAVAAGKTLGGQIDILKESFKNMAASLVQALLPAMLDIVGTLTSMTSWMSKNQETTRKAIVIVAGLAAGVIAVNAAYKTYIAISRVATAVTAVLNAVMAANPAVLITAAIIALGVAFVVAYKKSKTFRDIVNASFSAVKQVAGAVVDFVRQHWQTMLAVMTGGFSIWVSFVISHWQPIRRAANTTVHFIVQRWNDVRGALSKFAGWVDKYIVGPIKTIISWVKKALGWLEKLNPFGGSGTASSPTAAQRYAQTRLASHGWSIDQMQPLVSLWNRESGWNRLARNPTSGAYGIPQALPPSKMGPDANPPKSSAIAQIDWGLNYIKGRYGSPSAAWAHEVSHGWYEHGGTVPGPLGQPRLVVAHGGEQYLGARGRGRRDRVIVENRIIIDGREMKRWLQNLDKDYRRQNSGRSLLSGVSS